MLFPIGTKVKLVYGTSLWAQQQDGKSSESIYEVVDHVEDGTSLQRISVQALGQEDITFVGIDAGLFEEVSPTLEE